MIHITPAHQWWAAREIEKDVVIEKAVRLAVQENEDYYNAVKAEGK